MKKHSKLPRGGTEATSSPAHATPPSRQLDTTASSPHSPPGATPSSRQLDTTASSPHPDAAALPQAHLEPTRSLGDVHTRRQAPNHQGAGAAQAGEARPRHTASVHLLIGPVGAGKSTFARNLAQEHDAVRLTLDEWMANLFRADRPDEGLMPWYAERTARCITQIWWLTKALLTAKTSVILEIGLLRRSEREAFYQRLTDAGCSWTVYFLDAPREVRRARVEERNRSQGPTFSMVVPPAIFELASDLWEPPEPDEHSALNVRFIHTGAS